MQNLNPKSDKKLAKPVQSYMLPPSGKFSIGLQASAVLNAKIYYPSLEKSKPRTCSGLAQKLKSDLLANSVPGVSADDLASLATIYTHISENTAVASGTFPVIIFSPGTDTASEYYENVISDLVSQGYIVVGRDNMAKEKDHKAAFLEVMSIRQNLEKLHDSGTIFSAMNLQQIGLMGHSLGGAVSIRAAHKHPKQFQSVIALDAPTYLPLTATATDDPYWWDVRKEIKIPALQIHASTWQRRYSGGSLLPVRLTERNYHVLLTPDASDTDYSDHNNFSNTATLQYHPLSQVFEKFLLDIEAQAPGTLASQRIDPENPFCIGRKADGYEVAKIINQYIQQFFDTFLKQQEYATFRLGTPITGTLMRCQLAKDKSPSHSSAAIFAKKSKEQSTSHAVPTATVAPTVDKSTIAKESAVAPKDAEKRNDSAPNNAFK